MRRNRNVVVPADPHKEVAAVLRQAIANVPNLGGFKFATELPPSSIPNRFIRYEVAGSDAAHHVGDRPAMRIQVWLDGSAQERNHVANILLGFLRARGARKIAGPITMPDPVDAFRSLAQFEIEFLLIGSALDTPEP